VKRCAFAAPIGEARQIRSANKQFSRIFFYSLRFAYKGERIAAPIILAQHKGNKRIGEARITLRRASPIVLKLA
jgi:hypothetical protein